MKDDRVVSDDGRQAPSWSVDMARKTVVLICGDPDRAGPIRDDLGLSGTTVVLCAATAEDARGVVEAGCPDMLIYYRLEGEDFRGVDAVLWSRSRAPRPVPIVVLGDRYDEAEAMILFQLGVTDYLGVAEHADRLASLTSRLLFPGVDPASAEPHSARARAFADRLAGTRGG